MSPRFRQCAWPQGSYLRRRWPTGNCLPSLDNPVARLPREIKEKQSCIAWRPSAVPQRSSSQGRELFLRCGLAAGRQVRCASRPSMVSSGQTGAESKIGCSFRRRRGETRPVEVPGDRAPAAPRRNSAWLLHRLGRRRALSALLHRSTGRPGALLRNADRCRAIQQLDRHQCRRRADRRQADGHPGDAARSGPGQQLPQLPGQGHRGRVLRMERPRCSVPDAAETAPVRDPLLHPRSRRLSDRSGADHGPRGRLVARLAYVRPPRRLGEGEIREKSRFRS